ncbi:MAG: Gfo/Idh/MocA family oxidoreductase [Candidatus Melainabacteria bacterium]|nr:Gfo/Idh/MocA family oxidoreductase [Candidatus Melainabacteria bacterium]
MPREKIKVALVGFGSGGAIYHAPLLASLDSYDLTAIVTSNTDRKALAASLYPESEIFANLDSLLQALPRLGIDLAVISTVNSAHAENAIRCLQAGLHVVVDKPFALSRKQAESVIDIAKSNELVVLPYHNRRYDSDFLTVKKLLEEDREKLGKIKSITSRIERYREKPKPGGWRETTKQQEGGGTLYDLGSHLIDQAIALYGAPQAVRASVKQIRGLGTDDDVSLTLVYDGLDYNIKASMVCPNPGPRFEIIGDALYIKEKGCPQEDMLRAGMDPNHTHYGLEKPEDWGYIRPAEGSEIEARKPYETVAAGNWQNYYKQLAAHLEAPKSAPPPVPVEDALIGLSIIEEALQHGQN